MQYQRTRSKPFIPGQSDAFKISRSKIELFMQCPRCFWLDTRMKISRPNGPPFRINSAIDELFKREFDSFRDKQKPHPLMVENNVKAVPYFHENLDTWRANFTGVSTLHAATNLHIFGAIDDVWVNEAGELIVVDYKATAKDSEVSINADWQISYKRQLEVYQWLLRQNGFSVNDTGFFVYTNGRLDLDGFNDHLEFRTKLIPYTGDDSWVDPTLVRIKGCLESNEMPPVGEAAMGGVCDYCTYAKSRTELTLSALNKKSGTRPIKK